MRKSFSLLLALLGWFALIAQFILMLQTTTLPFSEMLVRFFSFFTILTNLMVAIYFSRQLFPDKHKGKRMFWNRSGRLTALTVYITVVGIVYQVALRHEWNPKGLQKWVDEILHSAIPILVIIYWCLYENFPRTTFKAIPFWLMYPLCYLILVLLRAEFSGFYPYPFLKVSSIGWLETLSNIGILFLLFLFLSFLLLGTGKALYKRLNGKSLPS
ncbi:Pr6Pr family membrane protein [Echinicola sediminis]